jgi:pilus assembly protein CpaB
VKRLTPAFLFTLMLVGVGVLVAAYAGKKLLARQEVVEAPQLDLMPVPVADLTPGTVITNAHLGQARIKRERLVPETVRSERILIGRVVKNTLKRAEPINSGDLFPPGEFPPLDLAPGMRAVSIDFQNASAKLDGLIRPGQYVDVHFSPTSNPDPVKGPFTMTLFKGVKVLKLGNDTRSSRGTTVSLELTPEQANIILLAKDKGQLQLTYTPEGKGNGGVAVADADRATLSEILGLTEPKKEEPPHSVEMFWGSSRSVLNFRDGKRVDWNGGSNDSNVMIGDAISRLRQPPRLYSTPGGASGLYSMPADQVPNGGNGMLNNGAFGNGLNGMMNANPNQGQGARGNGLGGGTFSNGQNGMNNGFSNFSQGEGL